MARWLMGWLALLAVPVAAFDLHLVYGEQHWQFSKEELAEMPGWHFTTETPWTVEADDYHGVPLAVLLETVGAPQGPLKLRLVALNDYAVETDAQKLVDADAVIVFERNGEPMPVRDYGPYWVLFPFSDRPELINRDIRNVSVWQLKTIEINP
ncbi:hypothetical protein E4656_16235 [Natronospirillum operosum]|uniref:Oxidoreductase n=1 Tax=Natronospirillum operosum TaxID=2759953 RepID=A0A4Z0W2J3_9GAMM|nr:hypothetical protein [Natronospirillum operosum]TGG91269.1 hypothetical protein E4656_16235 [Natronospirillum operosum]